MIVSRLYTFKLSLDYDLNILLLLLKIYILHKSNLLIIKHLVVKWINKII